MLINRYKSFKMKGFSFLIVYLFSITVFAQPTLGKKSVTLVDKQYNVNVVDSNHFFTVQKLKDKEGERLTFRLHDRKLKEVQQHEYTLLKNAYLSNFSISKGVITFLNYDNRLGIAYWVKWDTRFNEFSKRKVTFQKDVEIDEIYVSSVKFIIKGSLLGEKNHFWTGFINSDLSDLEPLFRLDQAVYTDLQYDEKFEDSSYMILLLTTLVMMNQSQQHHQR